MADSRTGHVLIHAAKILDEHLEGWTLINTPELKALAALRSGIICTAELSACVRYRTTIAFTKAAENHENDPSWFDAKGLYGFVFHNPTSIAYHACPGRTLYFTVEGITLS